MTDSPQRAEKDSPEIYANLANLGTILDHFQKGGIADQSKLNEHVQSSCSSSPRPEMVPACDELSSNVKFISERWNDPLLNKYKDKDGNLDLDKIRDDKAVNRLRFHSQHTEAGKQDDQKASKYIELFQALVEITPAIKHIDELDGKDGKVSEDALKTYVSNPASAKTPEILSAAQTLLANWNEPILDVFKHQDDPHVQNQVRKNLNSKHILAEANGNADTVFILKQGNKDAVSELDELAEAFARLRSAKIIRLK